MAFLLLKSLAWNNFNLMNVSIQTALSEACSKLENRLFTWRHPMTLWTVLALKREKMTWFAFSATAVLAEFMTSSWPDLKTRAASAPQS
jgi:hypothetical protein